MTKGAMPDGLIKCCENQFEHGKIETWTHRDFIDLNQQILHDTGINISPSTLKRIFGKVAVDEDYIPQQATIDALKKYGRYTEPGREQMVPQPSPQSWPESRNKGTQKKIIIPMLAVAALLLSLLAWWLLHPTKLEGNIRVTHKEGKLPATSFFELRLPGTDDSLFINFGDKSPMVYVKPGDKNTAHIYYFPGVFTVSLHTRKAVIATTTAYIESDSWIGFACHRQDDIPVHFYAFPAIKTGNDSLFQVSNGQLFKLGLDTTGPILTRLSYYSPIAQTADNFIFESTFKNTLPDKGIYCRSTQFQISGINNMIRFKLVSPGCSQRMLNVLSEQTFKGTTENLSQFVFDLSQWNTVKLVNKDKVVTLSVNGKEIFTGTYQQSLGDLRGLFLEFEGTGSVKNCDLKSTDGNLLYHF